MASLLPAPWTTTLFAGERGRDGHLVHSLTGHLPSLWIQSMTALAAFSRRETLVSHPDASRRPNQLELEASVGSLHTERKEI